VLIQSFAQDLIKIGELPFAPAALGLGRFAPAALGLGRFAPAALGLGRFALELLRS